jgi:hypothetical protein
MKYSMFLFLLLVFVVPARAVDIPQGAAVEDTVREYVEEKEQKKTIKKITSPRPKAEIEDAEPGTGNREQGTVDGNRG